jgi:hypothetical protein
VFQNRGQTAWHEETINFSNGREGCRPTHSVVYCLFNMEACRGLFDTCCLDFEPIDYLPFPVCVLSATVRFYILLNVDLSKLSMLIHGHEGETRADVNPKLGKPK